MDLPPSRAKTVTAQPYRDTMNVFQKIYWSRLAKPAGDRPLWNYLIHTPITSVLQVGVFDGSQTRNILSLAQRPAGVEVLRFAAVDPFESAAVPANHLRLKDLHRLCADAGVKTHLIPGEVHNALCRAAMTLLASDLVVVNPDVRNDAAVSAAVDRWLPRLIHRDSVVFARDPAGRLEQIAIAAEERRAAA